MVPAAEREEIIDVVSGARAPDLVGKDLTDALKTLNDPPVSLPWALYDRQDAPTSTDYVTLNGTLNLVGEVFYRQTFKTLSKPNRVIKVVIEKPVDLVDLELFAGLAIQPYKNGLPVGSKVADKPLLGLKLLSFDPNRWTFLIPVPESFDAVDVSLGGVLNVLQNVKIFEVSRTFSFEADSTLAGCEELSLYDALIDPDPNLYTYYYYNSPTDGSPRSGGATVTQSGTYYIEAVEQGTLVKAGQRMAVVATVLPMPGKPHLTISNEIN